MVDYLKTIFFHNATLEQVQQFVATYPNEITAGSPFNTGIFNSIYPQYKSLAALIGDYTFTLTRRLKVTNEVHPTVPSWPYISSDLYGTPILGTLHAADILKISGYLPGISSSTIQKHYISFFHTMDPNQGTTGLINWQSWSEGNQLVQFRALDSTLLKNNFKGKSYEFLMKNAGSLHI